MPVDARDLARDRVLIRPQDLAHVLEVETAREGGGANQVDEHHRELAAPPGGPEAAPQGLVRRQGRRPEGRRLPAGT